MAQYPFVKIFFGSDRLVHFMTYTDERRYGQYAEKHIGQGLIDFIELDLTAFAALLAKRRPSPWEWRTTRRFATLYSMWRKPCRGHTAMCFSF